VIQNDVTHLYIYCAECFLPLNTHLKRSVWLVKYSETIDRKNKTVKCQPCSRTLRTEATSSGQSESQNKRNTICILVRQSEHLRCCCSIWSTQLGQKRWWPHGTSASRASRGAIKHLATSFFAHLCAAVTFESISSRCAKHASIITRFSVNIVRNTFFETFAFHTSPSPAISTSAISASPERRQTSDDRRQTDRRQTDRRTGDSI